jgi:hypothetical protein
MMMNLIQKKIEIDIRRTQVRNDKGINIRLPDDKKHHLIQTDKNGSGNPPC